MSTVVFAYDWDLSLFCVSIESHKKAEDVLQIKLDEIGLSAECFSRYTDSLRPYIETMSQVCARAGWHFLIVTRNSETNVRYLLKNIVKVDDSNICLFIVVVFLDQRIRNGWSCTFSAAKKKNEEKPEHYPIQDMEQLFKTFVNLN